jgi:hypothetical protein
LERQQVMHAERVERDRARDDQFVVVRVVGEGRRAKGAGREQLGIRVGDPQRGLLENVGVDIGAERAQQVASRALHCVVIDAAGVGIETRWPGQRKGGHALIIQTHGGFALRASKFLPTDLLAGGKSASGTDAYVHWTSA